jgi:arginine decarboxylase
MDHTIAPVLEAVQAYGNRGDVSFTPPGHKQGRGADPRVLAVLGKRAFAADMLVFEGLDDRRSTGQIVERAQDLMADAVRAGQAFFSTGGSSLSIRSALLSVVGNGEKLVVGRNVHKSVVAGMILTGASPVWVEPNFDSTLGLAHSPSVEAYRQRLSEHPDARGVLVTSPTPYGACADLTGIADACHHYSVPLIIDHAWGAHLPFHPELPIWGMDADADICVTSIHKLGTGLEQGAILLQKGDLVDPKLIKTRSDLLNTTSPSMLLYAALDGWRRQMVQHGQTMLDETLALASQARAQIEDIEGLHVHHDEFLGPGRAAEVDPTQIVIDLRGLGITGYQAADWLRDHHHVNLHISDHRRSSALLTLADNQDTLHRLIGALADLADHADRLPRSAPIDIPAPSDLRLEQVCSPRDAYLGPTEQVPLAEAAGRVAAEMLTPYPPGIPVAIPGERLNEAVLNYLSTGLSSKMVISDAFDINLGSVRVIAGTRI